jgi:hypothetical protein
MAVKGPTDGINGNIILGDKVLNKAANHDSI